MAAQLQVPPLDFCLLQQATVLEACQADQGRGREGAWVGGWRHDDQAARFGAIEVQRTEARKLPCLSLAKLEGVEGGGGGGGGARGARGAGKQQSWAVLSRKKEQRRNMIIVLNVAPVYRTKQSMHDTEVVRATHKL